MQTPTPQLEPYVVEVWSAAPEPALSGLAEQIGRLLDRIAATAAAAELLLGMPAISESRLPGTETPALLLRWVDVWASSALDAVQQVTSMLQQVANIPLMPRLEDIVIRASSEGMC